MNFPMGNPFGRAHDVAMQRRILLDALELTVTATEAGVLVDSPHEWGEDFIAVVDRTLGAMNPQ